MSVLSLDTIANFATFLIGESPTLRGNQSHRLLTLILGRWFMPTPDNIFKRGNPFRARTQASHEALGTTLKLKRRWICELTGRLVADGWITTEARRLPNGQQEATIYRPGWRFKKLLITLLRSKQRSQKNRVHDQQQFFPSPQKKEVNQTDRQTDKPIPPGLVDGYVNGLAGKLNLDTKIRW